MKVSTKSRYGLIALIDIWENQQNGPVTLLRVAKRNQLSVPYLEHVFASLKKAHIVKSIKGPQGGYVLIRETSKITLAEILTALDGDFHIPEEERNGNQRSIHVAKAINEKAWNAVNGKLETVLEEIHLSDVVDEYIRLSKREQMMYFI